MTLHRLAGRIIIAELCAALVAAMLPWQWPAISGGLVAGLLIVAWFKGVPLTTWARLWLIWVWRRRTVLHVADPQVFDVDGIGVFR